MTKDKVEAWAQQFEKLKINERHSNLAEVVYWLGQYKLFCQLLIVALKAEEVK